MRRPQGHSLGTEFRVPTAGVKTQFWGNPAPSREAGNGDVGD